MTYDYVQNILKYSLFYGTGANKHTYRRLVSDYHRQLTHAMMVYGIEGWGGKRGSGWNMGLQYQMNKYTGKSNKSVLRFCLTDE